MSTRWKGWGSKFSSAKSSSMHSSSSCRSVLGGKLSKLGNKHQNWDLFMGEIFFFFFFLKAEANDRWLVLNSVFVHQQQLNTSFDDETAALLNGCYTLEEKERLKEEWRLFDEQKRNFEKERKNFTEAAIRLGREVTPPPRLCRRVAPLMSPIHAMLSVSTEKGFWGGPSCLAQASVSERDSLCRPHEIFLIRRSKWPFS